jgi:hypothetical protein
MGLIGATNGAGPGRVGKRVREQMAELGHGAKAEQRPALGCAAGAQGENVIDRGVEGAMGRRHVHTGC